MFEFLRESLWYEIERVIEFSGSGVDPSSSLPSKSHLLIWPLLLTGVLLPEFPLEESIELFFVTRFRPGPSDSELSSPRGFEGPANLVGSNFALTLWVCETHSPRFSSSRLRRLNGIRKNILCERIITSLGFFLMRLQIELQKQHRVFVFQHLHDLYEADLSIWDPYWLSLLVQSSVADMK